MQHWKLILPGAIVALAIAAAPLASAQSSGNFASQVSTTQCVINTVGGTPNAGGLSGGKATPLLAAGPGSVAVTQTKAFSQFGGVVIGP